MALLLGRKLAGSRQVQRGSNDGRLGLGRREEYTVSSPFSQLRCEGSHKYIYLVLINHTVMQSDLGIRFLSLLLEHTVTSKLTYFSSCYNNFLRSPLLGLYAKHMARPFVGFNYSCVLEWHLWIISSVRL